MLECREKAVSEIIIIGSGYRSGQKNNPQSSRRELLTETCINRGGGRVGV